MLARPGSWPVAHDADDRDGTWWRLLRYFSLGSSRGPGLVRVGFLAQ